jgi:hypothetical protein
MRDASYFVAARMLATRPADESLVIRQFGQEDLRKKLCAEKIGPRRSAAQV